MVAASDLHIHSALSPCGSLEMSPSAIVAEAKRRGLQAIAVTDHNSVENALIARRVGERLGVKVFCGMEAQSVEEVHLLVLFEDPEEARLFWEEVYPSLPEIPNNPEYFGDQVVVDEEENILRFEEKLLLNSLTLSLGEIVEIGRRRRGWVVPAHVESDRFGLLVQLGFIPPELEEGVLELSRWGWSPEGEVFKTFPDLEEGGLERARWGGAHEGEVFKTFPDLVGRRLVAHSDAHYLGDIGRGRTLYEVPDLSLASLQKAGREGSFRVQLWEGAVE